MNSLSEALRERTAQAHQRAEEATFIADLMQGSACPGAFAALARQHLAIYETMESIIELHYRGDPLVAPFADHRLSRTAALHADLAVLSAAGHVAAVCPATASYAEHLRANHTAEMMLAHHYVRYLGDLSGGQIVARMVERHYGIGSEALSFYRFPAIEKVKPYKDEYRRRLDGLTVTDQQRERILDEAEHAFELNRLVFVDLAGSRRPVHDLLGIA